MIRKLALAACALLCASHAASADPSTSPYGGMGFHLEDALTGGVFGTAADPMFVTVTNPSSGGGGSSLGTTGTPNIVGGSAGTPLDQGVGAAGANTLRAYIASGSLTVTNTNFGVTGAGGTTFTQGVGTANASSLNAYVGGGTVTASQGGAWSVGLTGTLPAFTTPPSVVTTPANGALTTTQGDEIAGSAAAGNPHRIAGKDGSGNAQDVATTTNGALIAPSVTCPSPTCVLTHSSPTASTSTTACPSQTTVVLSEEITSTVAVGIGLGGQALNAQAPGSASTTPELQIAANQLYTLPVAQQNAITVYTTTTGGVITCIQKLRS